MKKKGLRLAFGVGSVAGGVDGQTLWVVYCKYT